MLSASANSGFCLLCKPWQARRVSWTRFLTTLLFGITATDALTLVLPIVTMTAVSAGAAYFPARRASLVDPMVALRYE